MYNWSAGRLQKAGIPVAAFIVPAEEQVLACQQAGADAIELHTGMYANARTERQVARRLQELIKAHAVGADCGLIVHAGHGLNYRNIEPVAAINGLVDFNIGHSVIARAVFTGIREATREMIALIDKHSR